MQYGRVALWCCCSLCTHAVGGCQSSSCSIKVFTKKALVQYARDVLGFGGQPAAAVEELVRSLQA